MRNFSCLNVYFECSLNNSNTQPKASGGDSSFWVTNATSQSLSSRLSLRAREPNRMAAFAAGHKVSACSQAEPTSLYAGSETRSFSIGAATSRSLNRRFESSADNFAGFRTKCSPDFSLSLGGAHRLSPCTFRAEHIFVTTLEAKSYSSGCIPFILVRLNSSRAFECQSATR